VLHTMNPTHENMNVNSAGMFIGEQPLPYLNKVEQVLSSFLINPAEKENGFSAPSLNVPSAPPTIDGIVPDVTHGMNLPSEQPNTIATSTSPRKRKGADNDPAASNAPFDEEKKLEKKQRRLLKNREAAQHFRTRQKEYIASLENRAAALTSANIEANARLDLLASENKLMKEQLVYLRSFMKQAVAFSLPYQQHTGGAPSSLSASPVPSSPSSPTAFPTPLLDTILELGIPTSAANYGVTMPAFVGYAPMQMLGNFMPPMAQYTNAGVVPTINKDELQDLPD